MRGGRGVAAIAAAAVAGTCAGHAVSIAGPHAQTSLGGPGAFAAAVQVVAVTLLAAVGVASLFGRAGRTTSLLLVACAAVACLAVPAPEYLTNSLWFTTALATAGALAPILVCVTLLWPAPARTSARWLASLALIPTLLTGLIPTLLFEPRSAGCADCAENRLVIASVPGARDAVRSAGEIAVMIWCAAAIVLLLARLVRLPRTARFIVAPVLGAGLGIAAVTAGAAWHQWSLPTEETDRFAQLSWLALCTLAALLALGIAGNSLAYRLAASRLARHVLDANQTAGTLQKSYAELIGDPDLELVLNPADHAPPLGALRVVRDNTSLAEIRYGPRFADAAPRLREAVNATALAIEYAAAQDLLAHDQAVLVESRRRVVSTGDDTRYRIERNLHDGGQQRLVALALQLVALERRCDSAVDAARFAHARAELSAALDELRAIAHGLFPRALRDDGLQAALLEFRDRSPIALTVQIRPPPPALSADVSMAAYRLVTDLAYGVMESADGMHVDIDCGDGHLRLDIEAAGAGHDTLRAATRHAADRFAVLAGDVSISAHDVVRGVIPCVP
jgi:signal transduction histidine kinase